MALHFNGYAWILAAVLISPNAFAGDETQVASPDGSIQFKVSFKDGLRYEVSLKNKSVIEPSRMVFTLDGAEVTSGADVGEIKTYRLNETFPWRGAHTPAVNHC